MRSQTRLRGSAQGAMQTISRCACGKVCYPNEGFARMALQECRSKGRCEQRYYQCSLSNGWHLTSQAAKAA